LQPGALLRYKTGQGAQKFYVWLVHTDAEVARTLEVFD